MSAEDYTDMTVLAAEGARVGFVSCLRCGSAVLIDPRDKTSATDTHDDWHTASDLSTQRISQ